MYIHNSTAPLIIHALGLLLGGWGVRIIPMNNPAAYCEITDVNDSVRNEAQIVIYCVGGMSLIAHQVLICARQIHILSHSVS